MSCDAGNGEDARRRLQRHAAVHEHWDDLRHDAVEGDNAEEKRESESPEANCP